MHDQKGHVLVYVFYVDFGSGCMYKCTTPWLTYSTHRQAVQKISGSRLPPFEEELAVLLLNHVVDRYNRLHIDWLTQRCAIRRTNTR